MSGFKYPILIAVCFACVAGFVVLLQVFFAQLGFGQRINDDIVDQSNLKTVAIMAGFGFLISIYVFGIYWRKN